MKDGSTQKRTIKVIVKAASQAIKTVTFAGKVLTNGRAEDDGLQNNRLWTKGWGDNTTTAKSGKISVVMNDGFKLKKIEVGSPNVVDGKYKEADKSIDGTYTWKKVKNGKKVKLNSKDYSMIGVKPSENEVIEKKAFAITTPIRVTYVDKKAKRTYRETFYITKVQK
ncbi:hypothetical protein [Butyrivibrio sp. XPD2002]|uniref:hypothetical protein n=1 Tax=Butyrivibrio sp. XPD2002 TaxID=1280665 RepID=UPI00040D873D|nr:hypothetical protein [Butyrivibrio sp. XPD2002]